MKSFEPSGPKLLLVEGRDPESLVPHLLSHLNLSGIECADFGGREELGAFLKAVKNTAGFRQVRSLGIIRDADQDAELAFRSAADAVARAEMQPPEKLGQEGSGEPRILIFILPNNREPGMLETSLLESVNDQPAMRCVDELFECVQRTGDPPPKNLEKAKVSAYLATRAKGGKQKHIGESGGSGIWPFEARAFEPLCKFLQAI